MPESTRLYGPSGAPGIAGQLGENTPGAIAGVLPATQTVLVNTETPIVNPSLPTQPLLVQVPANSVLEQEQFDFIASGYFNLGTSSTVTLKLYQGTSMTISGNDTLLKSSGALSAFSGKTNWWIKAKLIYDSVSGTLTGTVEFFVNNVLVAAAALANVVTGLSNTSNPVLSLMMSVTFGTAGTQVISVKDFGINH